MIVFERHEVLVGVGFAPALPETAPELAVWSAEVWIGPGFVLIYPMRAIGHHLAPQNSATGRGRRKQCQRTKWAGNESPLCCQSAVGKKWQRPRSGG